MVTCPTDKAGGQPRRQRAWRAPSREAPRQSQGGPGAGGAASEVGAAGDAGFDALHFAFVGDALEVVAGGVGGFQATGLLVGDVEVEGGDGVVDLLSRTGADEGAATTGLRRSQARATWARVTPRASAMAPTSSVMTRSLSALAL